MLENIAQLYAAVGNLGMQRRMTQAALLADSGQGAGWGWDETYSSQVAISPIADIFQGTRGHRESAGKVGLRLQEARLAVGEGDFAHAEREYRSILDAFRKNQPRGDRVQAMDPTRDSIPLRSDMEDSQNAGLFLATWAEGEGGDVDKQEIEEEFVYVLLCVGEEEEALGMCEELLRRDACNITALKYKAGTAATHAHCLFHHAHLTVPGTPRGKISYPLGRAL